MPKPPNWHNEDGFEFALFPAKNGKAESLIVMLHGHGSNTDNWAEAAKQLHEQIPGADIITLQGPIKLPKGLEPGADGYTWLPYEGPKLKQLKHSLSLVFNHLPIIDKVNSFLDKQLEKRGLTEKELGIFGSSMGGIVALQTTLFRKKPVAGVVSHSGALLPFTKVRCEPAPDICLIMGGKDEVFCKPEEPKKGLKKIFNAVSKRLAIQHLDTLRRLRKKKIAFTEKFYPDLKHDSNPATVAEAGDFLDKALKKAKKPKP